MEEGGVGGASQRLVMGLKPGQGVCGWRGWGWASRSRWRRWGGRDSFALSFCCWRYFGLVSCFFIVGEGERALSLLFSLPFRRARHIGGVTREERLTK